MQETLTHAATGESITLMLTYTNTIPSDRTIIGAENHQARELTWREEEKR
jgi:hypothetical protein